MSSGNPQPTEMHTQFQFSNLFFKLFSLGILLLLTCDHNLIIIFIKSSLKLSSLSNKICLKQSNNIISKSKKLQVQIKAKLTNNLPGKKNILCHLHT